MPKPSPNKGNGRSKFACPYYQSRPHNLSLKVLCSGSGYWPRCEHYIVCTYLPVYEKPVQLPKEVTEDE